MTIVSELMAHSQNVSFKDRWGGTPLADAVREGHSGVVRMLVEGRANAVQLAKDMSGDSHQQVTVEREDGMELMQFADGRLYSLVCETRGRRKPTIAEQRSEPEAPAKAEAAAAPEAAEAAAAPEAAEAAEA